MKSHLIHWAVHWTSIGTIGRPLDIHWTYIVLDVMSNGTNGHQWIHWTSIGSNIFYPLVPMDTNGSNLFDPLDIEPKCPMELTAILGKTTNGPNGQSNGLSNGQSNGFSKGFPIGRPMDVQWISNGCPMDIRFDVHWKIR